jgi:hypothetical protein
MQNVAIIVAERGGEWLSWARALRANRDSTIVLAQSSLEDDASFAERVSERLRRLERTRTLVQDAAFVGGDRSDAQAQVQRTAILRRLSTLLSLDGRSTRLYLDAAARQGQRSLRLMRALGWTIADLSRGSGLSVRIGGVALVAQATTR